MIVKHSGMFSSIQDRGRLGLRHLGIPWAGVGCEPWMRFANRLLNQALSTPVIETIEGGLSLCANTHSSRVAIVGDVDAVITNAEGAVKSAPSWQSVTLNFGDTLTIKNTGAYRCAVVGIRGLNVKAHFNSASTYPNARLGGLNGTALQANDELPITYDGLSTGFNSDNEHDAHTAHLSLPVFTFPGDTSAQNAQKTYTVRAVPGPQNDVFTDDALARFFNSEYTISENIDRMGARLTGPEIHHKSIELRDMVSDAILPGSVQVPGSGAPIVMLADAHTVGGYPKIATVVSADLALFSLCRPTHQVRFVNLDTEQALKHTRHIESLVTAHLKKLSHVKEDNLSSERLLGLNLVGGVTHALK